MYKFVSGGLLFELKTGRDIPSPRQNIFDPGYVGNIFLYMFYGFLDATWETYAYRPMGVLFNHPEKLASFRLFLQINSKCRSTVICRVDSLETPFKAIFSSSWDLCDPGLIIAFPVVWMKIQEASIHKEDYITPPDVGVLNEKVRVANEAQDVVDR